MNNYSLFDTHAHYDHIRFKGMGPEIVKQLYTDGIIDGVVIPAISYESNYTRDLFPKDQFHYVYFAAGLHPNSAVNESWWNKEKRDDFDKIIDDRTVAIKTGLDFSKIKLTDAQKQHQIKFMKYFIDLANNHKHLPIVFHARDAFEEMINVLETNHLNVEAVVHCYTCDYLTAKRLIDVGVTRFGIGAKIDRPDMDMLRETVKYLPIEKILLETDAPFIKPEGFEGSVNTSESLIYTARIISEIKQMPLIQVVKSLQKNAYEFYRLSCDARKG